MCGIKFVPLLHRLKYRTVLVLHGTISLTVFGMHCASTAMFSLCITCWRYAQVKWHWLCMYRYIVHCASTMIQLCLLVQLHNNNSAACIGKFIHHLWRLAQSLFELGYYTVSTILYVWTQVFYTWIIPLKPKCQLLLLCALPPWPTLSLLHKHSFLSPFGHGDVTHWLWPGLHDRPSL